MILPFLNDKDNSHNLLSYYQDLIMVIVILNHKSLRWCCANHKSPLSH